MSRIDVESLVPTSYPDGARLTGDEYSDLIDFASEIELPAETDEELEKAIRDEMARMRERRLVKAA